MPRTLWTLVVAVAGSLSVVDSKAAEPARDEIRVEMIKNVVELLTDNGRRWVRIQTNQVLRTGDRLRTGRDSLAGLRLSPSTFVPFDELTEIEILPPETEGMEPGLHLWKGLVALFHKGKPKRFKFISQGATAGVDGTEFVMAVDEVNGKERTMLAVIDGIVSFGNGRDAPLTLTNGDRAIVEIGGKPVLVAGFVANNLLQWAFYYPAVLDSRELGFSDAEQQTLAESLIAYRRGDLPAALGAYGQRDPQSDAERIYQAALLLAVGQVNKTSNLLARFEQSTPSDHIRRLAAALRQQIAAVKREPFIAATEPELTSELMAASYYEQSLARGDESLERALSLAKRAATNSPDFGFAWARVAELEFSFGRIPKAKEALEKSLTLAPRNAQALALNGFLLAAENKLRDAIEWFDRAIAADAALANAWLGRGLCRLRRGESAAGHEDLLIAAALEPRRAELRSYLGKSYAERGEMVRALHEQDLAKGIDPGDPTAWLYSALAKAKQNRINEAIHDLEQSQKLNQNRRVYRSQLRLDQDRAVQEANLALLYADANLRDVAVREAGRAVTADYANYSAHLFLANSYETQRRAGLSNLRFETAAVSESLLASLLGPASGTLLAQQVMQLQPSRMIERNGVGLIANTEYFSRGAWRHSSAQYGTFNESSYSLEAEYVAEPGERRNQDYEIQQLEAKVKYDLTPQDSLLVHILDYRANGGDTLQHLDESQVSPTFRFDERQSPRLLAGYHREWSPGNHTLLLVGRVDDTRKTEDAGTAFITQNRRGIHQLLQAQARNESRSALEVYSAELQQIAVAGRQTLIGGARVEFSEYNVTDVVSSPQGSNATLLGTNSLVSFQRGDVSGYAAKLYLYDYVTLTETLRAMGGVAFVNQEIPANAGNAPITFQHDRQVRFNPKAGIVWSPVSWFDVRGSYTRSLIGAGLGESLRLEPAHVAGLVQTYRGAAPPALVGGLDGADVETAEVVWDARFPDTYVSAGWRRLGAERTRRIGLFLTNPIDADLGPSRSLIREKIEFTEQALELSAHRLLSKEWSLGARYELAYAELKRRFPDYDPDLFVAPLESQSRLRGWLHTIELSALFRHDSGMFAEVDGTWFSQDRRSGSVALGGDNLWQLDFEAGYRWPGQKAEIALGVLNILDNDYRLDPLNAHAELPRSRTLYVRVLLNF